MRRGSETNYYETLREITAVQNSIRKIKNNSDFFASGCVELIQKAANWSISFATGSNKKKRAFLENVSQGKGKDFFRRLWSPIKAAAARRTPGENAVTPSAAASM